MRYKELKITVDRKYLDIAEAELISGGFTSMMIDDPEDVQDILDHPETYKYDYIDDSIRKDPERKPVITLYFSDDEEGHEEMKRAEALVSSIALSEDEAETGDTVLIEVQKEDAGDDGDWLYKWQEYFKPTKVGRRIVVKPSWEGYSPSGDDLVIEMDPGMAFGSGLHGTTSMCIKALERILNEEDDTEGDLKVLDVGCGTGILAIAAALLGADECLGIDIDPDAVRVAQDNIAKNGLGDRIKAQYSDLTDGVDFEADIVVANLMADLVMRLSPAAYEHVKHGGWYITSGILDVKEEVVTDAIKDSGFVIIDVLEDGEWRAVIARKL
jgi:ribosomal protein L11 methyltransferase